MKKLFVSVGLAAAGAAVLPSAMAQTVEAATPTKWWNVSSSLRGFYDDNYQASSKKQGSFGFEVSPQLKANWDLQQTDIGIRYTYGMYYYLKRSQDGQNPVDHTHQADFWLDHAFTSRLKANLTDSFVVAQDPKLLDGGGAVTRVGGNNLANHASATLTADWTRQFSTATHYENSLYIYSESAGTNNVPPGNNPSQAALLNRIEQTVGNDFQWHFNPETVGFLGYSFTWVRYTGSQQIMLPIATKGIFSDARNYNEHTVYAGASHDFTPSISASGKAGVSYVDSYNNPVQASTSWAPYADINATYTYIPGSYAQAGFRQIINSTDVATPNANGQLTEYQESSVFYASVNHKITPKLHGSLVGQYQFSKYQGGYYDGQGDDYLTASASLNYQINNHFAAEAGYNFDELFSNVTGRGYTRNRVYIGLAASY